MTVVLHHIALTYGARSGWYYYEHTGDPATNMVLTTFLAVNRSYFMGVFFMVSGFFTPGSFDRKGAVHFIGDRLLRLGVPLMLFAFIVRPVLVYTMNFASLGSRYTFWQNISGFRNVAPGPLWFVETLLIFSGIYALWRMVGYGASETGNAKDGKAPGIGRVAGFAVLLGVVTFFVRILCPPDIEVFHLRVGNYPQYVGMYFVGIMAYRRNWLSGLTEAAGWQWVAVASMTLIIYVAMTVHALNEGTLASFQGGYGWQPLARALLENLLCVGMTVSLLTVFRKKWNFQRKPGRTMADDAYTVYIIHAPIIVYFTYLVRPFLTGHQLMKFCCVSVAGVALCFFLSHYVRKFPYAKKIL